MQHCQPGLTSHDWHWPVARVAGQRAGADSCGRAVQDHRPERPNGAKCCVKFFALAVSISLNCFLFFLLVVLQADAGQTRSQGVRVECPLSRLRLGTEAGGRGPAEREG